LLWIFNYLKPYTKKRANIGLGQYPKLSLSIVRERRRENLELLASNVDPSAFHKEQARVEGEAHQNTLKRITLKWL
jgi:hypothetical protein